VPNAQFIVNPITSPKIKVDYFEVSLGLLNLIAKKSSMVAKETQLEEVKMLSDKNIECLLDLDKCSLNELMNLLQKFANDPSFNVYRT
jgi:hypothetical protein